MKYIDISFYRMLKQVLYDEDDKIQITFGGDDNVSQTLEIIPEWYYITAFSETSSGGEEQKIFSYIKRNNDEEPILFTALSFKNIGALHNGSLKIACWVNEIYNEQRIRTIGEDYVSYDKITGFNHSSLKVLSNNFYYKRIGMEHNIDVFFAFRENPLWKVISAITPYIQGGNPSIIFNTKSSLIYGNYNKQNSRTTPTAICGYYEVQANIDFTYPLPYQDITNDNITFNSAIDAINKKIAILTERIYNPPFETWEDNNIYEVVITDISEVGYMPAISSVVKTVQLHFKYF